MPLETSKMIDSPSETTFNKENAVSENMSDVKVETPQKFQKFQKFYDFVYLSVTFLFVYNFSPPNTNIVDLRNQNVFENIVKL